MKNFVLFCISLYQKFISPYKGFSCAHRIATGEVGCSGYGKKVIGRYGVVKGYALLKRRFFDCKWHSKHLKKLKVKQNLCNEKCSCEEKKTQNYIGGLKHQQGFVDCGSCDIPTPDCGGCNIPIPNCDLMMRASDCIDIDNDCCSCGKEEKEEKFQKKRKKRNEKKYGTGNPDEVIEDNDD